MLTQLYADLEEEELGFFIRTTFTLRVYEPIVLQGRPIKTNIAKHLTTGMPLHPVKSKHK